MSRLLIFTGKGGVGKTSVAAAHARYASMQQKKTIIVSTDMAHNLGDIFERPIGKDVVHINDYLDALEVDPNHMLEHEFADMKNALTNMINASSLPIGGVEQLSVFPGEDQLLSLLKVLELYESNTYDCIIVDCAPTGETLSLLKFPEMLSWYMERLFPVGKVAMRVLAPISKQFYHIELPNKAAMTDIEKSFVRMNDLQELLRNREVTSIRLVAIPEKMVVEETKRNFMYMNMYDFHVDGLYINRILPKDIDNPFFTQWLNIQSTYIEELEAVMGQVPSYKIPWFETDINGFSSIDQMVDSVLKDKDVFGLVEDTHRDKYEKTDQGYVLKLYIPCVDKEDLDMHTSTTDIIIKVGNFKRSIPKPSILRHYEIDQATFVEDTLAITFVAI